MFFQGWARTSKTMWVFSAVMMALLSGTACQPQLTAKEGDPHVSVHEYALIEESRDNPGHVGFAQRAPEAVLNQREGWRLDRPLDTLESLNAALAPFDYTVEVNPTPPFRAFALYRHQMLLARDLASFGNLTIQPYAKDFALPMQTLDGQKFVATQTGLNLLSETTVDKTSFASTGPIYQKIIQSHADTTRQGDANTPARSLVQTPENVIYAQGFASGDLLLYSSNGQARIQLNTNDLPFTYDRILNDPTIPTFLPGGSQYAVWFYALRDGVWYYVEIDTSQ